jgi:subtilase family serine protease
VTIPAGTATGAYYIMAKADDGNAVAELSEDNNTYSWYITVGPDITITAMTSPYSAGAGKSVSITDIAKNIGAGDASASTTGFYLSTKSSLDASAVLLGSRSVPALAVGATSQGATTVTIPAGTAAGAYYLIARADDGNAVAGLSEDNNTYSWYLSIGP